MAIRLVAGVVVGGAYVSLLVLWSGGSIRLLAGAVVEGAYVSLLALWFRGTSLRLPAGGVAELRKMSCQLLTRS